MSVVVTQDKFNPWSVLSDYESMQKRNINSSFDIGASAVFVGTMRDFNEGINVECMTLEHYPQMAIRVLSSITSETRRRWALQDLFVIHRVGQIYPGEPIVLVAAWSSHRKEAFQACRHVMEELKSTAPFWKQEKIVTGEARWVGKNTVGY
ncbi:MAG: molybdenum cofactor biosynthesis protein MoaE [Gammaproteobacteria bacterium]|nr:molybdenum cofactor biosynthesis protein MoaE [Gammaproteobacteria bacterium]